MLTYAQRVASKDAELDCMHAELVDTQVSSACSQAADHRSKSESRERIALQVLSLHFS